jgi:hypothetical protein
MKTLFTKQELLSRKGCYSSNDIETLFPNNNDVTIKEILSIESVNIKDKRWFIYNSCELTLDEKKELSLLLSWAVLPIFENKYPDDKRVRECLDGIVKFNKNLITKDELIILRKAAYAAYAAYATTDAYAAADYVAYAAAATDAYAAAAAAAAYAADSKQKYYSEKLKDVLIAFTNSK